MQWHQMTDDQATRAARGIVATSTTENEIAQKLQALGHTGSPAICLSKPTDKVGREARAIVVGLGGLTTKDGAMVMMMFHGPRGNTLSV